MKYPNTTVCSLPPQTLGCDSYTRPTPKQLELLYLDGYRFYCRYLDNLSIEEIQQILAAGFALGVQQVGHKVGEHGWRPSRGMGTQWGQDACRHADALGLPLDLPIACDFEGLHQDTTIHEANTYLNEWSAAVRAAGRKTRLYVGVPLPPYFRGKQLWRLPGFDNYWCSGSKSTPTVENRGYALVQSSNHVHRSGIEIDDDRTLIDNLGGKAMFLVPNGWQE